MHRCEMAMHTRHAHLAEMALLPSGDLDSSLRRMQLISINLQAISVNLARRDPIQDCGPMLAKFALRLRRHNHQLAHQQLLPVKKTEGLSHEVHLLLIQRI